MHAATKLSTDFLNFLDNNSLIGIKGGNDGHDFLDIWMVRIGDRIFARSWNKSDRSWFTAFLETGVGQIKFGDSIIDVKGEKLAPDAPIQVQINRAYLNKYSQPHNLPYAAGIVASEYVHYTMEFIFTEH